jgi:hypothetical protein
MFLVGCGAAPAWDSTATAGSIHATFATLDTASRATTLARIQARSTPAAATSAEGGAEVPTASEIVPPMNTIPSAMPPQAVMATSSSITPTPPAPATLSAPPQTDRPVPGSAFQAYVDPKGRFSFLAPVGWQIRPSNQPGVAIQALAVEMPGNVNVGIESAAGATLDQYVAGALADIAAQGPQYRLEPPGVQSVSLGNHPGRRYDLRVESQTGPVHVTQFINLVDDTAYIVTFTSPESDHDLFARESQVFVATFMVPADTLSNAGHSPMIPSDAAAVKSTILRLAHEAA